MNEPNDTITAIATPVGEGGISVVRLSGKSAIDIADKCFKGKTEIHKALSHTAHYGEFADEHDHIIDHVVVTVFRAPHSYTGEDVVEISCHGGILITKKILETTLVRGARLAEPGEFTKRAFLNGRMDLAQAEAVADLIASRSELSLQASFSQLEGILSKKMDEIREKLIDISSKMELEIDFSEEDIEIVKKESIAENIQNLIDFLTQVIDSYELGKIFKDGVRVVLTGKPNVGKSSLMNALLQEDRAIVTHISGTTRDTIEENVVIEGLAFTIVDTAGLRETQDLIEKEGIKRTKQQIEKADVIMFIVEAGNISEDDIEYFNKIFIKRKKGKKIIIGVNKIDLIPKPEALVIPKVLSIYPKSLFSAYNGTGINDLKKILRHSVDDQIVNLPESSIIITNVRHKNLLIKAKESLASALADLKSGRSNEFVVIDIREAIRYIGEITGEITSEDILNNIFSHFCIGK